MDHQPVFRGETEWPFAGVERWNGRIGLQDSADEPEAIHQGAAGEPIRQEGLQEAAQ